MRAGGCTLQQALTPEAATLVKQSVNLAKRRGHAQVTPLHVASTMLSSSSGLLRAACLQSHSHPLQCKALELCFNVALNRLPASASSTPMLGHTHHHHHHHPLPPPALSNALVAAFKRAQAHQRRGSIETQQQPLLAVKIEIEQLVISILDDPSVSRVMREAGFSSTQVKSNVEQAVSLDLSSSTTPSTANPSNNKPKEDHHHRQSVQFNNLSPQAAGKCTMATEQTRNIEDVMSVVDCLSSRKKRSVVVVGECLATTEGVVKGMMDMVERGEVPDVLKAVQFINLPLFSFAHLSRDEVEQKVGELRCLVKSCCVGRGVVLYLGDLRWAAEYRASCGEKARTTYYCPVEHAIMELGRMISGGVGHEGSMEGRFWFMGIATYQTYMRCRVGYPSLESLWSLHPLTIPSGSLGLSLSHDSYLQSPSPMKRINGDASHWSMLDSGCDCSTTKSENGSRTPPLNPSPTHATLTTSSLPSWLQRCKEEKASTKDLEHPQPRNFLSNFNDDQITNQSRSVPFNAGYRCREACFWRSDADDYDHECLERNPGVLHSPLAVQDKKKSQTLLGLRNPSPLSTSASDSMEMEHHHRFKELNAENLKTICIALEKKAPWQMDMIPEIASTVLQCRSGMIRRKERSGCNSTGIKEDTWLFFQGCDAEGKEIISRELANLVFGCHNSFISIGLRRFPSTKSDCSDDPRDNKRPRSEESYVERFSDAIRENPHRVFLMEDIEQLDHHCQKSIKAAMERGMVCCSNGEEYGLGDAIVVLSCESFDSRSRACSPPTKQKVDRGDEADHQEEHCGEEATSSCVSLDLNISVEDCEQVDQSSLNGVSLVDSVDRRFFFGMKDDYL